MAQMLLEVSPTCTGHVDRIDAFADGLHYAAGGAGEGLVGGLEDVDTEEGERCSLCDSPRRRR